MADRSLSYYLGPHLSQGLLNAYNAGRGLLEFMSPGADVRDAVQSSQSAMQNLGQGNVGSGLLDLVYTPAALAGMFIPGSIGGTRRVGEAAVDEIIGLVDDVDPSMPSRLVNRDDLPMDEASRMARAREMGFDTDVYHGTNENITAFDPEKSMEFGESWFSSSPKVANDFAMYRRTWPGANIMPAKIRGNFLEFDGGGKPIRTAEQSLERHLQVDLSGGAQMNYGETVGEYARRKGYDGIRFSNVTDDVPSSPNMGQPSDIYAVFDPKNIRSRFAKFDPSKKDSANILAGVGGGLLATGVLAEQRKKKDDMAAKKPKGKKK